MRKGINAKQTAMASRTLVFLLTFVCLGVLAFETVQGVDCHIRTCLGLYDKKLPPCNVEGEGYVCLKTLHHNCSKETDNISKPIHSEYFGYKHAMKTVCDQNTILDQYRKNPHCWYGGIQCGRLFDFTTIDTQKQYFCKSQVLIKDDCIKNIGLPSDCSSLHEEFVNLMFKASPCGGTTFVIQTVLLIVSAVLSKTVGIL